MLVDSHSHLFLNDFSEDLPQVIGRAKNAGVNYIFMPNIDSSTIAPLQATCKAYEGTCFPMIGLHPTSVDENVEKELLIIENELQNKNNYVAIGEIGIDLYWDKTYLNEQVMAFERQVQWALKYELPIVVHSRNSFHEVYNALQPYKNTSLRGIFHSFTGTVQEAKSLLEFSNFMIGINGVVTFKNSKLPEVLKSIPLNRIVTETDSPYLTPAPNRGKRNESANIRDIVSKLEEVYQEDFDLIAEATSVNAFKMFGIPQ